MGIYDLRPATFNWIAVPTKSEVMGMAVKLQNQSYGQELLHREPSEITESVLDRGGRDLTAQERRQLPFLILDPKYGEAFGIEVLANYSKLDRFWARLFKAWLMDFDRKKPIVPKVLAGLKGRLPRLPERSRELISRYPFLLSTSPDFSQAAVSLLKGEMSPDDRTDLGLSFAGATTTEVASKLVRECALYLSKKKVDMDKLQEFKRLVAPNKVIDESVKLYAMIGLILGVRSRPPGDAEVKDIANLIERNFADPVASTLKWPGVPEILGGETAREQCLKAVRKWQVFRSITLFFEIIERVVESENKHQFPLRRKFWMDHFDKGEVQDALVILGSQAQEEMKGLESQGDDYQSLKWAKLSGGPSDQCALLMKLGDTTVMEFSHSGRVRMWGKEDASAGVSSGVPLLSELKYKAADLRADCPENQMFRHDTAGNWRTDARKCIARLSGRGSKL